MVVVAAEVVAAANEKSRRLRELLLAPEILVMPGAFDVLSARLFEAMGFPAIQGTSGGIAAVRGLHDDELLGLDEIATIYRELAEAVAVPVNADGEKGYGGPDQMPETVRQLVAAGVAGMNLEDSVKASAAGQPGLEPLQTQLDKIAAIMQVKCELGSEFFLNARVDALGVLKDRRAAMQEAVERGNAYAEAGADCIFILRPGDRDTIGELVREIRAPLSVLAGEDTPPVPELQALGVARVSYGTSFTRYALTAVKRLAETLLTTGDPRPLLRESMPRGEMLGLLRGDRNPA
jgi:2-methylisocitrate lyase-like PEP mutase family enzyme